MWPPTTSQISSPTALHIFPYIVNICTDSLNLRVEEWERQMRKEICPEEEIAFTNAHKGAFKTSDSPSDILAHA